MRWRVGVVAVLSLAGTTVAFGASAGATSTAVADEAEYRAALTALSADTTGPHTITLSDDIEIAGTGDPSYTGTQPLTVDGDGHSITVTAADTRAIQSTAALTLDEVEVSGGDGSTDGGGILAAGDLTVRTSYLHDNTAAGDGGGARAGGTLTIERSTLSANSAVHGGGASAPTMAVDASTITGNTATTAGGGLFAGALQLDWSTVLDGSAPVGANLGVTSLSGTASVVAGPQGGGANCSATSGDIGSFKVSDSSCGTTALAEEPEFADLADNGGPTPTRYPGLHLDDIVLHGHLCGTQDLFGPPLVLPLDQRGEHRGTYATPGPGTSINVYCDVGAVEVELPEVSVVADPAAFRGPAGTEITFDVEVTNTGVHEIFHIPFGPFTDAGCTAPTEPLAVGDSMTVTCTRSIGGTPSTLDEGRSFSFSVYDRWKSASASAHYTVRVLCADTDFADVGPALEPAVTWFLCDAVGQVPPFPRRFFPDRRASRSNAAGILWYSIGRPTRAVPQPFPYHDVPVGGRQNIADVTFDPDGAGPRRPVMEPIAPGRFGYDAGMTRGDVVRGLWRDAGRPSAPPNHFTDVPAKYDAAVSWATADPDGAGPLRPLVRGATARLFRPNGVVTQGQVVSMVHRYVIAGT